MAHPGQNKETFSYEFDDSDLKDALESVKELSKATDELISMKGDFMPDISKLTKNVGRLSPQVEKLVDKFRDNKDLTNQLEDTLKRIGNIDQSFISDADVKMMNDVVMDVSVLGNKMKKNMEISEGELNVLADHEETITRIEDMTKNRAKLEDLLLDRVKETADYKERELSMIRAQREEYKKMLREKGIVGTGIYGKAKSEFIAKRDIEGPDTSAMTKSIGKISNAFKGLGGTIMKAFGPLLALFTITEFLEFDKKVKDTRKELTRMAAESGRLYKNIGNLDFAGPAGDIELVRLSMDNLLGDLRLTGEEAQETMDSMVNAGFTMEEALGDTIKKNDELGERIKKTGNIIGGMLDITAQEGEYALDGIKEIHKFSVLTGQSIGEAAKMAGDWKMQLGVAITNVSDLFVKMTKNASEAGYQTSKFFDKVMQTANGLIIYGNKIEQTSDALSDLMKGLDVPKEVAAELATGLLTNVKEMSNATKAFIADTGNAEKELIEQIDDRRKKVSEINDLIIEERKKGNEAEAKALERRRQDTLDEIELYERIRDIKDPFSKSIRMLEVLDPAKQLEAQMRAMVNSLNITDEMGNVVDYDKLAETPKKLEEIFNEQVGKLDELAETFGMSRKQVRFLGLKFKNFADNVNKLNEIEERVGINSDEYQNALKELPTKFDDIGQRDTEKQISEAEKLANAQVKAIKDSNTAFTDGLGMIADILKNKIYITLIGVGRTVVKALNMIPGIDVDFPDFKKAAEMMKENTSTMDQLMTQRADIESISAGDRTYDQRLRYADVVSQINVLERENKMLKEGRVDDVMQFRREQVGDKSIKERNRKSLRGWMQKEGYIDTNEQTKAINQKIMEEVNKNLNRPYKFGGKGRGAEGIDCSGFVGLIQDTVANQVFDQTGDIMSKKDAASQILSSKKIDFMDLKPGDIVGVDASSRKGYGRSGVDHILQVYANELGELMVAESREGEGVVTSTLEKYLDKAKRNAWGVHFGRPQMLADLENMAGKQAEAFPGQNALSKQTTVNDNKTVNININGGDLKKVEDTTRKVLAEERYQTGEL